MLGAAIGGIRKQESGQTSIVGKSGIQGSKIPGFFRAKFEKILKIQKNTPKIRRNTEKLEKYPEKLEKYSENPEKYVKFGRILRKK